MIFRKVIRHLDALDDGTVSTVIANGRQGRPEILEWVKQHTLPDQFGPLLFNDEGTLCWKFVDPDLALAFKLAFG